MVVYLWRIVRMAVYHGSDTPWFKRSVTKERQYMDRLILNSSTKHWLSIDQPFHVPRMHHCFVSQFLCTILQRNTPTSRGMTQLRSPTFYF